MKTILSIVTLSAVVSTGAIAGKTYGGVGVALTSVSSYDSGISLVVNGGMKMDKVLPNLVFEGEISYTLDVLNIGAYAGYNLKIPNTSFTLKPRVGLNYENLSFSSSNNRFNTFGNNGGVSLSFGVGGYMPISNGMTAYVDFTDKGFSNNFGVGVQIAL